MDPGSAAHHAERRRTAQHLGSTVERSVKQKKAPDPDAFLLVDGMASLLTSPLDWPALRRRADWLPASCALPRRVSAILPEVSSGSLRTPSGRSADRHRPWRIRQAAAAR